MATFNPISTLLGILVSMLEEGSNAAEPSASSPPIKQNLYILCTGTSGCGSSYFINRLIESSAHPTTTRMKVGEGIASCTKKAKWTLLVPESTVLPQRLVERYNIYLGDAPGFNFNDHKTKLTDPEIIEKVRKSVQKRNMSGSLTGRLGILVLHSEDSNRATSRPGKQASQAAQSKVVQHAIIVSTKSTSGSNNAAQRRALDGPSSVSASASPDFEEFTDQEDPWSIVRRLVEKVDASNRTIRQGKSWYARYFGWMKYF